MCGRRCFFIGHREASVSFYEPLLKCVEEHIVLHGVTDFFVGQYGNFDHMAARAVMEARKRHPHVSLFILTAYHPSDRKLDLPEGADGLFYPPDMESVPRRLAIARANRYMIDHSSHIIACVEHPGSNASKLIEYANRRQKRGLIQITLLS